MDEYICIYLPIEKYTKLKQDTENDFENDFFLIFTNNSAFERIMMNVRKQLDIKLIFGDNKYSVLSRYVSKSDFLDKNLAVVQIKRIEIKFNQSIYEVVSSYFRQVYFKNINV